MTKQLQSEIPGMDGWILQHSQEQLEFQCGTQPAQSGAVRDPGLREAARAAQGEDWEEKWKSPKERGALSIATQKSLDRKRQIKAAEMGTTSKEKSHVKQKASSATRILQPSQGQNAPAQRLLHRQGIQTSRKGVEQYRQRYPESRFRKKAVPGACPGRVLKTKSSVTTL
ncbi:centriolar coiled-coil protein of 110 kDa-like [Chiloscyllium plagiosum]|uniref:centriolar coiled-coil protein of 110 kDa-like n=1 Tax=Chiloscyllium plagiosum TaxID=36176 RepID=UPI001CB85EC1|nr:centriolar coiled-coil protein of 110 kDa-like [Chiloscyllium plagiosum]